MALIKSSAERLDRIRNDEIRRRRRVTDVVKRAAELK